MKRKRINWDEEIKKTEQIRWKGIRFTLASFALALFWILGAGRMGKNFPITPLAALLFFVGAGTIFFIVTLGRKNKKQGK